MDPTAPTLAELLDQAARAAVLPIIEGDVYKRTRLHQHVDEAAFRACLDPLPQIPQTPEFRRHQMSRNGAPGVRTGGEMWCITDPEALALVRVLLAAAAEAVNEASRWERRAEATLALQRGAAEAARKRESDQDAIWRRHVSDARTANEEDVEIAAKIRAAAYAGRKTVRIADLIDTPTE